MWLRIRLFELAKNLCPTKGIGERKLRFQYVYGNPPFLVAEKALAAEGKCFSTIEGVQLIFPCYLFMEVSISNWESVLFLTVCLYRAEGWVEGWADIKSDL